MSLINWVNPIYFVSGLRPIEMFVRLVLSVQAPTDKWPNISAWLKGVSHDEYDEDGDDEGVDYDCLDEDKAEHEESSDTAFCLRLACDTFV